MGAGVRQQAAYRSGNLEDRRRPLLCLPSGWGERAGALGRRGTACTIGAHPIVEFRLRTLTEVRAILCIPFAAVQARRRRPVSRLHVRRATRDRTAGRRSSDFPHDPGWPRTCCGVRKRRMPSQATGWLECRLRERQSSGANARELKVLDIGISVVGRRVASNAQRAAPTGGRVLRLRPAHLVAMLARSRSRVAHERAQSHHGANGLPMLCGPAPLGDEQLDDSLSRARSRVAPDPEL